MKDVAIYMIIVFSLLALLSIPFFIGYITGDIYTLPDEEEDTIPLDDLMNSLNNSNDSLNKSTDSVGEPILSVIEGSNQIIREEEREEELKPMRMIATGYCSCKKCCGIWAENRENGIVYTASGAIAQAGHTIAVDTSVIPFGSVVLIDGVAYVAEDTGSAIIGNRIDIYFDSHDEALQFGIQELTVYVKS